MSPPRKTISWHAALATVRGRIAITVRNSGSRSSASRQPPGSSGCFRKARVSPISQLPGLAVHPPGDPLDGAEQIHQHRHAGALVDDILKQYGWPSFPARRRVWISVISRNGDTGAATRFSSPEASSRAMKSRKLA